MERSFASLRTTILRRIVAWKNIRNFVACGFSRTGMESVRVEGGCPSRLPSELGVNRVKHGGPGKAGMQKTHTVADLSDLARATVSSSKYFVQRKSKKFQEFFKSRGICGIRPVCPPVPTQPLSQFSIRATRRRECTHSSPHSWNSWPCRVSSDSVCGARWYLSQVTATLAFISPSVGQSLARSAWLHARNARKCRPRRRRPRGPAMRPPTPTASGCHRVQANA